MAAISKACTKTTKSMAKAFTRGPMDVATTAPGAWENNTAKESTRGQTAQSRLATGKMGKGQTGCLDFTLQTNY